MRQNHRLYNGEQGMATYKATNQSQTSRQQPQTSLTSGKAEAARMTLSPQSKLTGVTDERWQEALQTYCDYFIRY
jgi:hypothetical protein